METGIWVGIFTIMAMPLINGRMNLSNAIIDSNGSIFNSKWTGMAQSIWFKSWNTRLRLLIGMGLVLIAAFTLAVETTQHHLHWVMPALSLQIVSIGANDVLFARCLGSENRSSTCIYVHHGRRWSSCAWLSTMSGKVQIHMFLTSVPDGEWSATCPIARASNTQWIEISCSCQESFKIITIIMIENSGNVTI